MKRRLRSFRSRLLAIVMATTLAALAFSLVGSILGNAWSFHRQQFADMLAQATLVGRMTSPALSFEDPALAQTNLELFDTRPDVRAAALYDADGRLFASYRRRDEKVSFPTVVEPDGAVMQGSDIIVFKRIVLDGVPLGTIHLRVESNIALAMYRGAVIAALAALAAMLLAWLLVRGLARVVIEPIAEVASVARDVVTQRDYSRRVERTDEDEIGELVESFNEMLREVEQRTEQLETSYVEVQREAEQRQQAQQEVLQLNADLERRVQDRTLALEHSNRELTTAMAAADEASMAKSSFLATMSHEIRTPMNGVIGMIDVLHQTSLRSDQVEMVGLIRESAFSLLSILDDTLDFSKIEAGRMEIESAPLSLTAVVENTSSMLDQLAARRHVELTLFIDPAIPDALLGDALRLRQVLVNLINNAIKFSAGLERRGRVAVRARRLDSDDRHVQIAIDIIDNGIGMNAEARSRLFTAFNQADTSTTRRFGGTGLGLAISRQLVGLMGGELEVDSTPDVGTTFTLILPFERAPDAAPALVSEVAGLDCLVVGSADSMADDIACYLAAQGARIARANELRKVPDVMAAAAAERWVLVVDGGATPIGEDDVHQQIGRVSPHWDCVLVGRGVRRLAVHAGEHFVRIDGNVMTRRRLGHAVALAAGRVSDEVTPAPENPRLRDGASLSREQARQRGRLILIAEDNETNQKVLLRQLSLLGYTADVVDNGRLALDAWRSGDYALLLTDLHMPEMDGYALTAAIRAGEANGQPRSTIIAFTANALKGEGERCKAAGMDDYVTKPVQLVDLRRMLESWMPDAAGPPVAAPGAVDDGSSMPSDVIDVGVLERFVGSDPAVIARLLGEFRVNGQQTGAALISAWAAGDLQEAWRLAHKLKSSARTVGALPLSALCERIEVSIRSSELQRLEGLQSEFSVELAKVMQVLDRRAKPG